ncbi:YbaB/EbfC family DNA-binding protein [Mycolicibacterium sp. S2-37]|uniref:YbaB/EbfC family DNA-binding protein n=1 Tax=Mycolicibacterium sp. S2-37 TaxID=2810297 RepID=UPI001A94CFF4|nr:YbaB/EbfC family DNA-binding protein [Mycolicibacterium sp. S2-37]MBO0677343.1 YbaB/EbfC family DNA-binding protein [Mycolicibacterium sp. S2-37]
MVDRTDNDDLTAFDFAADGAPASRDDDNAFDFSAPDENAADDPFADYTPPEPATNGTDVGDLADDEDDAEPDPLDEYTHTVFNPSQSVTVSALVDGSIRQVELSPKATEMTEDQLVEEILVLAHLARQRGLAGQRSYLEQSEFIREGMGSLGLDADDVVRDFVDGGMGLPTEQEVAAEQAEVFATRYADDGH